MQRSITYLTKLKGGEGKGEAPKLKCLEAFHFKLNQKWQCRNWGFVGRQFFFLEQARLTTPSKHGVLLSLGGQLWWGCCVQAGRLAEGNMGRLSVQDHFKLSCSRSLACLWGPVCTPVWITEVCTSLRTKHTNSRRIRGKTGNQFPEIEKRKKT